MPVYDRVALQLVEASALSGASTLFLRARAHYEDELTVHWITAGSSRGLVRVAEFAPWLAAWRQYGPRSTDIEELRRWTYVRRPEPQIAYSFVACSVRQAADRVGVSETTLTKAIDDGYLIAHRAGDKGGKRIIRAVDLDEWVQSLPTERVGERWSHWA
ncbi:helix-turn-helix domain-containing protein [Cellulomonas sp. ACRRI]|uniref:helix-turn-helix domain-containing protein n=1 Tax=Cellulomonas sp. ACRRI TaxID=2918188 RepID=UPI001EF374AD|nr:helix-turn-helix domain-containing protein [Cellulomonas sp. ACRRI]MCG7284938.1 helix-turn-helix domain-containing protein [Cellulomonas sp. ACRRI]